MSERLKPDDSLLKWIALGSVACIGVAVAVVSEKVPEVIESLRDRLLGDDL